MNNNNFPSVNMPIPVKMIYQYDSEGAKQMDLLKVGQNLFNKLVKPSDAKPVSVMQVISSAVNSVEEKMKDEIGDVKKVAAIAIIETLLLKMGIKLERKVISEVIDSLVNIANLLGEFSHKAKKEEVAEVAKCKGGKKGK